MRAPSHPLDRMTRSAVAPWFHPGCRSRAPHHRSAGRWAVKAMQASALIVGALPLMVAAFSSAMHPAPPPVSAITNAGVRYVVPNDKGLRAYVEARDVQSGQKLWTKTIFRHWYIPPFGTECMRYEYLSAISLQVDKLKLTSDRGRDYLLDIRTRTVRRVKKQPNQPTAGNAGSASRFQIGHEWPGVPESER